jgi:hypothetical protein
MKKHSYQFNRIVVISLVGVLLFVQAASAFGQGVDSTSRQLPEHYDTQPGLIFPGRTDPSAGLGYVDGEIIISFDPAYRLEGLWQIADSFDNVSPNPDGSVIALVKLKVGVSVTEALEIARREPGVYTAGLNHIYTIDIEPYIYTMDTAMRLARIVCGAGSYPSASEFAIYDLDKDGALTMTDVLLVMRKACGL